jgi:hypothetical protein
VADIPGDYMVDIVAGAAAELAGVLIALSYLVLEG